MELLRIVAMFLVLLVHASGAALDTTIIKQIDSTQIGAFSRSLIYSFSIISVNVFILLSGWYGIHAKVKRLTEFIFQCLFFVCVTLAIAVGFSYTQQPSVHDLISAFMLNNYWFCRAYIILYIMTPALNAMAEKCPQSQFKKVLIAFFIMQTIYGWLSRGTTWYELGYSPLSFMGLYLLARYMRLYRPKWSTLNIKWNLILFVTIVVINTLLYKTYSGKIYLKFNVYSSPMVIAAAVLFLLSFTKISLRSRFINWIASSCFAVYLLHMGYGFDIYKYGISRCYQTGNTLSFIVCVFLFMILVFVVAVLIDKVRIRLWNTIIKTKWIHALRERIEQ